MARYKVLKSVAHNFAHSFVSPMNYGRRDHVMCELLKKAHYTGVRRFELDVLRRMAGPVELLSRPILDSVRSYCSDFGGLVTNSGAALDMVSGAWLTIRLTPGTEGKNMPSGVGRVAATMRIVDDRGKGHLGRAEEEYRWRP